MRAKYRKVVYLCDRLLFNTKKLLILGREAQFMFSIYSVSLSSKKFSNISGRFCKGVYAISVSGRLPAGVIREMKSRGFVYRPRDTSQR